MGMRTPPHMIKIMLESNPLKSRILVRRLAVSLPLPLPLPPFLPFSLSPFLPLPLPPGPPGSGADAAAPWGAASGASLSVAIVATGTCWGIVPGGGAPVPPRRRRSASERPPAEFLRPVSVQRYRGTEVQRYREREREREREIGASRERSMTVARGAGGRSPPDSFCPLGGPPGEPPPGVETTFPSTPTR